MNFLVAILLASIFEIDAVLFPGPCPVLPPLNSKATFFRMDIVYVVPLVERDTQIFRETSEVEIKSDCHVMNSYYFNQPKIDLFDYGNDLWVEASGNELNNYSVNPRDYTIESNCNSETNESILVGVPQSGYNIFGSCRTLEINNHTVYDIGLILGVNAEERRREDVTFQQRKKQFNSLAQIQFNLSLDGLVKWSERWITTPRKCQNSEAWKCPHFELDKITQTPLMEIAILGVILIILVGSLVWFLVKFAKTNSQ